MTRFILAAATLMLALASCSRNDRQRAAGGRTRVDVGTHKLEFLVTGVDQGRPAVVLESGLGSKLESWEAVQKTLGRATRVVSYNRAGIGGSQPGRRPRHAKQIVAELRTALRELKVEPPYILVGHSLGGIYVRAYAALHADEVVGLVLADPTMEFREPLTVSQVDLRLQRQWGSDYALIEKVLKRIHPQMAVIAAHSLLELEPYFAEVPQAKQQATRDAWLKTFADRAQQIEGMLGLFSDTARQELFASMQSMRVLHESPHTNVPVTLLVAGKADHSVTSAGTPDPMQAADYVAWSQKARLRRFSQYMDTISVGTMSLLHDAGHNIPQDRPDAIVNAVNQLLHAKGEPASRDQ